MAITYASGVYTIISGSHTPADCYAQSSSGITRLNGSRVVYDFGASRIIINSGATFTIQPDDTYGEIMFSNPGWDNSTYLHHIWVKAGGTLNVGAEYSQDIAIVSTEAAASSYLDQNREYRIEGELNWIGGIIVGGTMQVYSGATGSIDGFATFAKLDGVDGGSIRASEPDFGYNACRLFGGAIVPFVETTDPLKGFTFINCSTQPAVGLDNDTVTGAWMLCEDWDVSDASNQRGFGFWDVRWARYINQATGTDFVTGGNLPDHVNNKGLCEVRQSVTFEADSGSGAKFYTIDTNNGNRLTANQIANNPDYTANRSYTLTESGGQAVYDTDGGVLIGVHWRTTGGVDSVNNNFDSRGINNNKTDIFNWLKVQYGYQPASLNIIMKGKGGVQSSIFQLPDLGITETNRAPVAAYTGLAISLSSGIITLTISEEHTLQEFYDYIKYWESENPAAVWANGKESFATLSGTTYIFNHTKITIASSGDSTIDNDVTFDATCGYKTIELEEGGTLTFGSRTLVSGQHVYTNPIMRNLVDSYGQSGDSWSPNFTSLYSLGGTINLIGGRIETKMNIHLDGDGSGNRTLLTVHECTIKCTETRETRVLGFSGFNQEGLTADSIVDGLIIDSDDTNSYYEHTLEGANVIVLTTPARYVLSNAAIVQRGDGLPLTFKDFDTSNNRSGNDVRFDDGAGSTTPATCNIINPSSGVRYVGREQTSTIAARMKGYGLTKRRIAPVIKDASGAGIVGAKVYTKDTNNGERKNFNNHDDTDDKEYTLTASTGGVCPETDIILEIYNRPSGTTGAGTYDTGLNRIDRRSKGDIQGDPTQPLEFDCLVVAYGKNPQTYSDVDLLGLGTLSPTFQAFVDLGITESTKATVTAYTGITPVYSGGTLTVTVTSNHTWNEVYDFIKYYESENPASVWANGKESFVSTSNKLSYTYNNLVVVVNGATLSTDTGQSLPTQPTVESGGKFISGSIVLFYDGAKLVKASQAYFQVKDSVSAANIEGCVIGFGDATTETLLLYNSSFALDTLVTDADGKASGYFAFQKGGAVYGDMKQETGEYSYIFSTIPRTLNGASIGSSSSPELIRLAPETQVTLSKTNAGLVSGITVDVPTDTIDLSDETLSNAYDSLKYQLTADADIDTGIPGCMYFCLYGLPLTKSGASYTGRSSSTIYKNMDGSGGSFSTGIVELDTAGTYPDFTFGDAGIEFLGAGVYDMRSSTFNGTIELNSDVTVEVKLPVGASFTNNDLGNVTVTQNIPFVVSNPNIIDESLYYIKNVTQDTYLVSGGLVSGGAGISETLTFGAGEEIESGDIIEIVISKYEKSGISLTREANSGGISFSDAQADCSICTAYGIDQATALSYSNIFATDYPNIQIDFDETGTFNWGVDQLFVWAKAMGATDADFQKNYKGIFSLNSTFGHIIVNSDVVDLFLDNPVSGSIAIQTNTNPNITGRPALTRSDGVSIEFPRTDGGKIILNPSIDVVVATVTTAGDVVVSGDLTDIQTAIDNAKAELKGADDRDLTEVYDNGGGAGGGATEAQVQAITDAQTTDLKGVNNKDLTQVFDNTPDVNLTPVIDLINGLNDISVSDIEASTVLAREATLNDIANALNDLDVDLSPVLTAISNLNDVTAAEVRAAFDPVDFKDKNTELEVHSWLDSYTNKSDWKASDVNLGDMPADVTAIKAKTDNLPADPAAKSDVPTAAENALELLDNQTAP